MKVVKSPRQADQETLYVKSPLCIPRPLCGVCVRARLVLVFLISCVRKMYMQVDVDADLQVDVDADFDVEDYIHSHVKP